MNEFKRVFIHIRWPLQSFTLLGFLFGLVTNKISPSNNLIVGFASWLFLCAGITVFNSFYDKDKHAVAGLENPPEASRSMLIGSWLFKICGLFMALGTNILFFSLYVICVILSVLYSHERFRFKSNGYVAVLFNFIIGFITYIVASSLGIPHPLIWFFGGITSGFYLAAIYLMMQVHQKNEDYERKDRSVMVMHGKKITLSTSIFFLILALLFSLFTFLSAHFSYHYFLFIFIYFVIVVLLTLLWLFQGNNKISEFQIMNRLTLRISYLTNVLLIVIYLFEVVMDR